MSNNNAFGLKIQQQITRFSLDITKGLSRPEKRFISQALFGIQASRDIKLSNISRSLNEDIKLLKTEQRLSRHMMKEDLTKYINEELIKASKFRIKHDTVLALDLLDIYKQFAKKMEYLAKVYNGSEGSITDGYWLCGVIAADVEDEHIIPLYSELSSQDAEGFISENEQILKAIRAVNNYTQTKGIWTIDRGGDRQVLIKELDTLKQRFLIRLNDTRHYLDAKGNKRTIPQILKGMRYKDKYTLTIDKEGYAETIEISLARRDNLYIDDVGISIVAVKGFGKEPMLLLTNAGDKTPKEIVEIYLTRWKCEESFRFLKQEYHLEDVQVRGYTALKNTVVLLHAVFYFLSVYLGRRLRMSLLISKIIEKAKRFFEVPVFKHYAVADGIYRILFNRRWDNTKAKEQKRNPQLLFGFA